MYHEHDRDVFLVAHPHVDLFNEGEVTDTLGPGNDEESVRHSSDL